MLVVLCCSLIYQQALLSAPMHLDIQLIMLARQKGKLEKGMQRLSVGPGLSDSTTQLAGVNMSTLVNALLVKAFL